MAKVPHVRKFKPHQLGYLLRQELAKHQYEQIWETPEGKLLSWDLRQGPLVIHKLIAPRNFLQDYKPEDFQR